MCTPHFARSAFAIALLLLPLITPLASADPVTDTFTFEKDEAHTVADAGSNLTRNGFVNYFAALGEASKASANAGNAAFQAYGDALGLADHATRSAGSSAFTAGQGAMFDSANVTQHAGDATFSSWGSAGRAEEEVSRDVFNATAVALAGTVDNAESYSRAQGHAAARSLSDAAETLTLTRSLTDPAFVGTSSLVDGISSGMRAYGETAVVSEQSAIANGTIASRSVGDAALNTTNAGSAFAGNLLGALGRNALTSYQQALTDAGNVTRNATDAAYEAYFGALNTANDAADATGIAVFTATYAAEGTTFDIVNHGGRSGFDTYFNTTAAAGSLATTAGKVAVGSALVLTRATFGVLSPESQLGYGALVPCDPATGGGFQVMGRGECVGAGIVSYSGPITSPLATGPHTSSSGGYRPYDRDARSCSSTQYGFAVIRRDSAGRDFTTDSTCVDLRVSAATGMGVTNSWEGLPGRGDSVRIDYKKPTATLVVTDDYQDFVGILLVIENVEFVYETQQVVPQTLRVALSGINVGLLDRSGADERLRLDYDAPGYNDWIEIGIQPDASRPQNYDLAHLGSFRAPTGQSVDFAAPNQFSLDVNYAPHQVQDASVTLIWSSPESTYTPLAITITKDGVPSSTFVDSLPATAQFRIGFRDVTLGDDTLISEISGSFAIGESRVRRVWLPTGMLDVQLTNVPTMYSFSYRDVRVIAGFTTPCDQSVWDQVAQTKDPNGQRQICVRANPYQNGAELDVDGGAIALWGLPSGQLGATLGPLNALWYGESSNSAYPYESHATLFVHNDPRLPGASLLFTNMKSLYLIAGQTLASGASATGCGTAGQGDPIMGRPETTLRATFTDQGSLTARLPGAGGIKNTIGFDQITQLQTTSDNRLDLTFATTGGTIKAFEYDTSSACNAGTRISIRATGLISVSFSQGNGDTPNQAKAMITRLDGTTYARLDFSADSHGDSTCGSHQYLGARLAKEAGGAWHIQSDLDFPGGACGSPAKDVRIRGDGEFNQDFRLGWVHKWVATYRLLRT